MRSISGTPADLNAHIIDVSDLEALQPVDPDWPRIAIEPLRGPMAVKTFLSPDCSYVSLRELLRSATEEILLYIYNVSARHTVELLAEALARGVRVRIMYDAMDTRGEEEEKLRGLVGSELRVAPSKQPRRAFTHCHQKFLVVDRRNVVVESANWATTSIPLIEAPGVQWRKGNREWFIQLASEGAAAFFAELFQMDWDFEPARKESGPAEEKLQTPRERGLLISSAIEAAPDRIFAAGSYVAPADVEIVPICSPQNYLGMILPLLEGARESVCIEQQYIKGLDQSGHVVELVRAVRDLPSEVEVRFVSSPAYRSSWDDTVATLKSYDLEDRLRAINLGIFNHNHNKGLIVDGRSVLVSSTNWSDNSIGAAREAGVLVHDPGVAGYYQRAFDLDWETGWPVAEIEGEMARLGEMEAAGMPDDESIHPADLV